MKKNNIALALSLLMVAGSLIACGKKGGDKSSSTPAPESSVPAATSEAHTHSFSQWAVSKEATHTEEGEETRTCVCGEKETRPIAKMTDHEFGEWTVTKPATHTEEGEETRTCLCGEKETRPIAKTTDHEFGEWTVTKPATHTEEGEETRTCACGEKETKPIAKTTEHEYGEWKTTKEATCTEKGEETRSCACGLSESRDINPKGHSYSIYTGICKSCGDDSATEITPGQSLNTTAYNTYEYHTFKAAAGKYKFKLSGGTKPSNFKLYNPSGEQVAGADFGVEFETVEGVYRAVWVSKGSSPYILECTSHEHSYAYDGKCEYCDYSVAKAATQSESATTTLSCATTEVLYYTITLRAGTYTLSWNATCLDYVKIYNDEGLKLVDATGATEIKAATFTLAESTVCHVVLGPSSGCMGFNIKVA